MIPAYLYRAVVRVLHLVGFYEARSQRYGSVLSQVLASSLGDGALVLDLGCGPGNLTVELVGRLRVIGVDKDRYPLLNFLDPSIPRVQARAERLPFRSESTEAVVAISLLEHIVDQGAFFEEVARVLRPGGYGLLQIPELKFPIEPHTKWPFLLKWNPSLQSRVLSATGYVDLNLSTSISDLPRQCAESGLTVEQTLPLRHFRLAKLLRRPMGYFVVLRKQEV